MSRNYRIDGYDRKTKTYRVYRGPNNYGNVTRGQLKELRKNNPGVRSAYKDFKISQVDMFRAAVKNIARSIPFVSFNSFLAIAAFTLMLVFLKSPTVPFTAEQLFNAIADVPTFPGLSFSVSNYFESIGASGSFFEWLDGTVSFFSFVLNIIIYVFNLIIWGIKALIHIFGGLGL